MRQAANKKSDSCQLSNIWPHLCGSRQNVIGSKVMRMKLTDQGKICECDVIIKGLLQLYWTIWNPFPTWTKHINYKIYKLTTKFYTLGICSCFLLTYKHCISSFYNVKYNMEYKSIKFS
jgi:hypothetical protein